MIAAPFAWSIVIRQFWGLGEPWEVTIAYSLRNVAFGAALLRTHHAQQRLAVLASVLLLLFSFLLTFNAATITLTSLYVLLGAWWLMGAYWERLSGRFPARVERSIPRAASLGAVAIVAILSLGVAGALRGSAATTALAGFFPSSGGTAWSDPRSRGGVGDGDQLVSAERNAATFGPLESEQFLESEQPTLYDMINEAYNEPVKRNPTQRAIPLSAPILPNAETTRSTMEKATREFETVRQRSARQRVAERDEASRAVLQVIGRVPVHLRMEVFNHWDGTRLSYRPDGNPPPKLSLRKEGERNWASVGPNSPDWMQAEEERHALRILHLASNRVPSPPYLDGVHVDRLHMVEMFRITDDGGVALDRDQIPSLTVLHVASAPPDEDALYTWRDAPAVAPMDPISPRIAALARAWTRDAAPGWTQVEAVCRRLRREYRHDRAAIPTNVVGDSIEHFLYDSKQGPDYLFATSAALLLRELGYQTRVVNGFYADSQRYDPRTQQTAVMPEDVHFWTEVLGPDGIWLTVEPTPGYEVLYARVGWMEQTSESLIAVAGTLWQSRWTILGVITVCTLGWRYRLRWGSFVLLGVWRAMRCSTPRRHVLRTLWALDLLSRLARRRRPPGTTFRTWLERIVPRAVSPTFSNVVGWALYSKAPCCSHDVDDIRLTCLETLQAYARALMHQQNSRVSLESTAS
jgi:hypothetical protein